jgi:hypothetical protein
MNLKGWIAVAAAAASIGSSPIPEKNYRADVRSPEREIAAYEGETAGLTLIIKNRCSTSWESKGSTPCFVSYHVLDAGKRVIRFENPRFSLLGKIAPGQETRLPVVVKAPLDSGDYYAEFDLLIEGRTWFKDQGSQTLLVPLKVTGRDWPEKRLDPALDGGAYTKVISSVPEFNSLLKLIRITLKHNEVSFAGKSGRVDGFAAGAGYPQIWLRDANTIIPASMYFYPLPYLDSWLGEHLTLQKPGGSLWDWVDSRGAVDKNTVETDQEASAVQAGFQVFKLEGKGWPVKSLGGRQIVDRLEEALAYVLNNRFDPGSGLITGAHTADWGDVEAEDTGRNAVYFGATSHRTSDIYDQSMFYEAALNLADMFDAVGQGKKSEVWRYRAERIKARANDRLWMSDKGFYRVHVHVDPFRHDFAEDDIFAMGGNVQAVISGLAAGPGADKSRRIIEKALAGQKAFGISTVSGSLLPPYPGGFFRNPAMDEEFEYQNGGQWDWFGGKLVLIMFESGFSREAREKLIEIARKDLANGGLFEWDTKDGAGRGSDFYSGSAGSLARALIEGYFGIRISGLHLELSPRLGLDNARVHVHVPASGRFLAYDYRADDKTRRIRLEFGCDDGPGPTISILNPWASLQSRCVSDSSPDLEVRINGGKVPFRVDRVGRDEYIRLDALTTRFKKGVVEVRVLPMI